MCRIAIIVLAFIFICCKNNHQNDIKLLYKTVGEHNTIILEQLVGEFETYLQTKYPKNKIIDVSYTQYLKAIASGTTTLEPFMSTKIHKQFIASELFYEKNRNSLVFKHDSLYMSALSIIAAQDPVVNEYYKVKQKAGLLQNTVFSNGFLKTNPNFNNKIHRLIVVLEFSY